jgi:alpha-galactosidase
MLALNGDPSPFVADLEAWRDGEIEVVRLVLSADEPAVPPRLVLELEEPLVDAVGLWTSGAGRNKGLAPSWKPLRLGARATTEAPLLCLFSGAGMNRLTLACSDPLHRVAIEAGVIEESAALQVRIELFGEAASPATRFVLEIHLDRREVRYERALADAAARWAEQPGCGPAPVPALARAPMYSTWYSFHQRLDPAAVEDECRRARALGCEAVIIDDGWQTLDASRGYAFTGDWEPERIPDLGGHVARLHQLGMAVLLWYSVPFVGISSRAFERFRDQLLYTMDDRGAGVLDPRYPEVRDYLISTWEQALGRWDLDGLKLDFVDRFVPMPGTPEGAGDGRDVASVMEAVDRLLADAIRRLRARRPEVLIEFRQPYVGPLMRHYGNMFRANDCPADLVRNRIATLDIRLLAGDTACHGDMLMWHPDEPVESAALQLLAVWFAVPQISVRLDRLPSDHLEMLRFWLGVWRESRETLLDGELRAASPELGYPLVTAFREGEMIAAVYADVTVGVRAPAPARIRIVNATRGGAVTLLAGEALGGRVRVRDCRGLVVRDETCELAAGAHRVAVPPAGLLELTTP